MDSLTLHPASSEADHLRAFAEPAKDVAHVQRIDQAVTVSGHGRSTIPFDFAAPVSRRTGRSCVRPRYFLSSFAIRYSVFPYGHTSRGALHVPKSDCTMPESTGLICPSQSMSY